MILGSLADIQMGYPFRSRLRDQAPGPVAVVQMKDIDDGNQFRPGPMIRIALPPGTTSRRHLIRAGDLLFRSRGSTFGAAVVTELPQEAILAAPMLLIRPHGVQPDFLCWYINSPAGQAQLAALAAGSSVRMVSAESLKTLDVPVPPVPVQQRVAEVARLAAHEQALTARIAELRQTITNHRLMQITNEARR